MTLPASGYLLLGGDGGVSGRSVNSEFGYGNDLASYRGAYYGLSGQLYQFPTPGNSIAMDVFYSTYAIVPGSATFNNSQTYVIPVYNTLTITVKGGNGGQSGSFGYSSCGSYTGPTNSSNGGGGSASSFGGYLAAGGGSGGTGNAGAGGAGVTSTTTFTNPLQGGGGPSSGSSLSVTVGNGGSGGSGGPNFFILNGICANWSNASSGSAGAKGYVSISWA